MKLILKKLFTHSSSDEESSPKAKRPILKLEQSAFSKQEWVTILQHSISKPANHGEFFQDLQLQVDHLSKQRLRESFIQGLDTLSCESFRTEIWKLLCNVQNYQSQFTQSVYSKLLSSALEQPKILKDIHRTRKYCEDFALNANTGKNRLYNVLTAYSAYDPEIGYC